MTRNLKQLPASAVVIIAALLAGGAAAQSWQVVTINEMSLAGPLKEGTEFEVRIEARKPKELRDDYFGTVDQPASVIAEIVVRVGGKKTPFPKEAFEDLANPLLQTVSLTSQPSGEVKLRFTGGTRPPTYEVEYFVQDDRLTKRTVKVFEAGPDGVKREVIKTMTF